MTKNTPLHLIPGIITIIMLLIAILSSDTFESKRNYSKTSSYGQLRPIKIPRIRNRIKTSKKTNLPYNYYILLRWVVSGTCVWFAFACHQSKKLKYKWLLTITAIIYTPINSFHLGKDPWTIINTLTIPIIIVYYYLKYKQTKLNQE